MGGEGHIADMVQRSKQNRQLLRERRERTRNMVERMYYESHSSFPENIPVEELEKIEKEIADKERSDKRYYRCFTIIFLGSIFLLVLLALWIF